MTLRTALFGGAMLVAFSAPAFAANNMCEVSMTGGSASASTAAVNGTSAAAGVNNTTVGTNSSTNRNNEHPGTSANAENNNEANNKANNGNANAARANASVGSDIGGIQDAVNQNCKQGDIVALQVSGEEMADRAAAGICNFSKTVVVTRGKGEQASVLCEYQGNRKLEQAKNND